MNMKKILSVVLMTMCVMFLSVNEVNAQVPYLVLNK